MRNPISLLQPKRRITGVSALLLPFLDDGSIDWESFENHVTRTLDARLAPAANMDTGFASLIDGNVKRKALTITSRLSKGRMFMAGAVVNDEAGHPFDSSAYKRQLDLIQSHGGVPVVIQSYGLCRQSDEQIVASYRDLASACDRFVAFELGKMFAPFGKIYSRDVVSELMKITQCWGIKHSSLNRQLEWERIELRNALRSDFKIFTGNDLAVDMVMYGSDYLLGLSTFAPDAFSIRDRCWEIGDPRFYRMNDLLQFLGRFAFRDPVPAYRHSAAQFLHLRNWVRSNATHPQSPVRPESDIEVLTTILQELESMLETSVSDSVDAVQ